MRLLSPTHRTRPGPRDWSPVVSSRLELLDWYWYDFVDNHVALTQSGIAPDHQYVVSKTYAKTEATYVGAKGRLLDAGARLRPGTSGSISSPNPWASSTLAPQQHRGSARFPRITVPEFGGRREEWEPFRDLFKSLIHNDSSLSDVDKLFYLKTHVKGEARSALDSFQVTDANSNFVMITADCWSRITSTRSKIFESSKKSPLPASSICKMSSCDIGISFRLWAVPSKGGMTGLSPAPLKQWTQRPDALGKLRWNPAMKPRMPKATIQALLH